MGLGLDGAGPLDRAHAGGVAVQGPDIRLRGVLIPAQTIQKLEECNRLQYVGKAMLRSPSRPFSAIIGAAP